MDWKNCFDSSLLRENEYCNCILITIKMSERALYAFWNEREKKDFNNIHNALYKITDKEWQNMSCIILMDLYNRTDTGSLIDEPVPTVKIFKHLGDLNQYRKDCDGAYRIRAAAFLQDEYMYTHLADLIDNQEFGTTAFAFKYRTCDYCLYLESDNPLFRRYVEPYTHYGASWFDDYNSS